MTKQERLTTVGLAHNPCQGCDAYYTSEGLLGGCAIESHDMCDWLRLHDQVLLDPEPRRASNLEPDLYQFPPTRFVSNSPWRQWWHLLSEVLEIGKALLVGNLQHAARETWDVKQSSETMHRILSGQGADIELAREEVVSGCLDRGYYNLAPRSSNLGPGSLP